MIEGNIKIFKNNNDELEDNDITINERDIKVTGQFKTGKLIKPFTLNTKVKLNFTREIDINGITADMIINWKEKYTVEVNNPYYVYETEKLESLPNKAIELVIKNNLKLIIQHKISGIDNTKFNDHVIAENTSYDLNKFN